MTKPVERELVIIGAGPAGMAAAVMARQFGLSVLVLDDNPHCGGQVWRQLGEYQQQPGGAGGRLRHRRFLGIGYRKGLPLVEDFAASGAEHWPGSAVWQITADRHVFCSRGGTARQIRAGAILIANGAMERPVPLPGWQLPGVMTVGAAQTMLKTAALGCDEAVFIGSGPLFYLTIWQYLEAGLKPAAVLDTARQADRLAALPWVPLALLQPAMLADGLRWISRIRRQCRYFNAVSDIRLGGTSAVSEVSFRDSAGISHQLPASQVFLHQGVVPNINLTMATGLEHYWHQGQRCWHPLLGRDGASSMLGVFVAGDGGGINGAMAAITSGRLVAAAAARFLGCNAVPAMPFVRLRHAWHRSPRALLEKLYPPRQDCLVPAADDAIICRCEGLDHATISRAISEGVAGPNQLKAYCRAGMGRCQGRMCGLTIAEMISRHHGQPQEKTGYYRLRPPVRPVTLEMLASLHEPDETACPQEGGTKI